MWRVYGRSALRPTCTSGFFPSTRHVSRLKTGPTPRYFRNSTFVLAGDFYSILGVQRTATQDEIKKAYRKLAMELHPDRHKGDKQKEEKFKQISEAYSTLSDQNERSKYDMMHGGGGRKGSGSSGGFDGFGFGTTGSRHSTSTNWETYDFNDWADFDLDEDDFELFGGMFHGRKQQQKKKKKNPGANFYEHTIDFDEETEKQKFYDDLRRHGYDANFEEVLNELSGRGKKKANRNNNPGGKQKYQNEKVHRDRGNEEWDHWDNFSRNREKKRQEQMDLKEREKKKIVKNLVLNLEEMYTGTTKEIQYVKSAICEPCGGHGGSPTGKKKKCSKCDGRGWKPVNTKRGEAFGVDCTACGGLGFTFPSSGCTSCKGSGVVNKQVIETIEVPAGADDGDSVVLEGKGHEASKYISGDLIVFFEQIPHEWIKRNGKDLFFELKLSLKEAIYGYEREFNFLGRQFLLKSDPNGMIINSGSMQYIRGVGMPATGTYKKGKPGNLYIKYTLLMPNGRFLTEDESFDVCFSLEQAKGRFKKDE